MKKILYSSLAIMVIGSSSVAAQKTKIDVQKGQKYMVETTTKFATTAEVMGQTMENSTESKTTTIYEILKAGPDEIKLGSTITKMQVNASMMGQEMTYDSDKKDNEGPFADVLSKMVNKSKEIKLDSKGSIAKQDVPEEIVEGGAMLGANNSGYEAVTELFIPALIGKKLTSGNSFIDISAVKKEKFSSADTGTYKITAIENGVASISYNGTQTLSLLMEQMGMEMTSNSNNIVKTELQVDVLSGLVLTKATVVESTTTIEAAGMTIPATGKTITTHKISRVQ